MHLYLAIFWLVIGVLGQVYWETLKQHAYIPVERATFALIFVVLFGYNFMRWRLTRMAQRSYHDDSPPPPKPRVVEHEYNPELDFSDQKEKKDDASPSA
jgi:hypothetical protein